MLIRDARIEDAFRIGDVHVASWRETYPGLVPDTFLSKLSPVAATEIWTGFMLDEEEDPSKLLRVVIDERDGDIVGFAAASRSGSGSGVRPIVSDDRRIVCRAELTAIYLLRRAQRRGLGRELHTQVRDHCAALGLVPFGLWVLAGNPAEEFYRHLGGVAVAEKAYDIDGSPAIERAYAYGVS